MEPANPAQVVVGVHTILKQCHPSYTRQLLADLGQFICASVQTLQLQAKAPTNRMPLELRNAIWILDTLCSVANTPKPTDFIPAMILATAYKADSP